MKGARIHGILLAAAAVWAFQTWTRDEVREEDRNRALAWEQDTTAVAMVRYRSSEKEVVIRRREDDGGAFLWGTEIENEGRDTLEFPVGASGHTVVARLAALRVIRDLGPLSPEQEARFGLDGSEEQIAVAFDDDERLLILGDTTFGGGSHRYALQPAPTDGSQASGSGYVLPGDVVRPLAIGEGSLRERWLHHYSADEVARVRVTVGDGPEGDEDAGANQPEAVGRSRTMDRLDSGEWAAADGEAPDAGFGNFMQRVDQLAIAGYDSLPPADRLRSLLRVEYYDEDEDVLGFVELFRDDSAERDPYYIRSERTRILAAAVTALAERVAEGLGEAF